VVLRRFRIAHQRRQRDRDGLHRYRPAATEGIVGQASQAWDRRLALPGHRNGQCGRVVGIGSATLRLPRSENGSRHGAGRGPASGAVGR